MKKIKGKKGFLFTFITVFLLFSLLVLTYDYMQRNRQSQEFISDLTYSDRLNFIRENLVSDYFSLLDIELESIERTNETVVLKFSNFSVFRENNTYPQKLNSLENFIENDFSNMSNLHITLHNFVPEFYLYPYNTTFIIDDLENPSEFFILMGDYGKFNEMNIDIILNTSISDLNSTNFPSNDSTNDPKIITRVFDKDNNLIMNKTIFLSSTEENEEYNVSFNKVVESYSFPTWSTEVLQNLIFSYGKFRKNNPYGPDTFSLATFHLKVTGLEADIEKLHLNFTSTEEKAILRTKASMFLE